VRIERVDEAMLGGARVVSQRLRGRNHDLICIRADEGALAAYGGPRARSKTPRP
jgi:hypothetical protein